MSGEGWGSVVDFAERRAWVLLAVIAFVLFAPEQAAQQIGVKAIREQWNGYLWVALVLVLLLTLAGLFRYIDRRVVGWFARRVEQQKEEKLAAEKERVLALRLNSLNADEYKLVVLCLFRGSQSFHAELGHTAAESLCNKDLARRGSGRLNSVAYHLKDATWEYMLANRKAFLPEKEASDPAFIAEIERFESSLEERW